MSFKEIPVNEFIYDGFTLFGDKWPLLGCGDKDKYNAMTISWGHYGSLWGHEGGRPTTIVYTRDTRYTHELMDENNIFSLSILPEEYRDALSYMGSHTGRREDKIKNAGLHPLFSDNTMYIEESEIVLFCRKLYVDHLKEDGFIDKDILSDCYPKRDLHTVYIGEIIKVLVKE